MELEDDFDEEFSDGGWVSWFCSLDGHEFFAEIDDEYLRDNFNLYGLRSKVAHFRSAHKMLLSLDSPDESDLQDEAFLETYQDATDLYGLIHSRYIVSPRGLAIMREKFLSGCFGTCPRVMCERSTVLPVGMSEELRTSRVKVYCPKCQDIYVPKQKSADVDGAYFGCSFPHLLMQVYSDLNPRPILNSYVPSIYGFRIFEKKGSKFYKATEEKPMVNYYKSSRR